MAPDRPTAVAFLAIVVLGGLNGVSVRFSNQELPPFWGATLRFVIASAILFSLVAVRRIRLPRGDALMGTLLYGLLAFGGAFAFVYWGLVETPAGAGQTVLAVVPLLTLLFAVAAGLERFRPGGLIGAVIALAGVAVVFAEHLGADVPLPSLLAILAGAACMAGSNVVAKRFPKCHPVANNAIAMGVGAVVLLAVSLIAGETQTLPASARTWIAVGYLSVVGSVVVFSLFLFVIARWSASASSYVMLLMPLVTVAAAAVLAGEPVTATFVVGGALVLLGVYVGAFAPSPARLSTLVPAILRRAAFARPAPAFARPAPAFAAAGESDFVAEEGSGPRNPGCA
jgi:drug/metabolite transporter (DMT)-like permease